MEVVLLFVVAEEVVAGVVNAAQTVAEALLKTAARAAALVDGIVPLFLIYKLCKIFRLFLFLILLLRYTTGIPKHLRD